MAEGEVVWSYIQRDSVEADLRGKQLNKPTALDVLEPESCVYQPEARLRAWSWYRSSF